MIRHPPHAEHVDSKLGKVWTADTLVSKKITWLHEVVYTSQGQSAIYGDMSVVLFDNSYLMILGEEPEEIKGYMLTHLQEIMEYIETYGWKM